MTGPHLQDGVVPESVTKHFLEQTDHRPGPSEGEDEVDDKDDGEDDGRAAYSKKKIAEQQKKARQ